LHGHITQLRLFPLVVVFLMAALIAGCTALDELADRGTTTSAEQSSPTAVAPSTTDVPSEVNELESLARQLNADGLITQELADKMLASMSVLDAASP